MEIHGDRLTLRPVGRKAPPTWHDGLLMEMLAGDLAERASPARHD